MSDYDPNFVPKKNYLMVGQKAIVLNNQGKILMLKRSNKTSSSGKWSLPGGGIDRGEDPTRSIEREIREETGLTVSELKPFKLRTYFSKDDFILIAGYVCKAENSKVRLNWEHDDYQWLTKADALKLELTGDARYFVKRF